MSIRNALVVTLSFAAGCAGDSGPATHEPAAAAASASKEHEAATPRAPQPDASQTTDPNITVGIASVELFFGAPFPEKFKIEICPHRADFDAYLKKAYGWPNSECWMVATGVADGLALLDPVVWKSEACEHDGSDAGHVQRIVTHELVHVFHGQKNPTRDFTGMDDLGWFCEGLACYASGQLDKEHAGKDVEALKAGVAPKALANAWSGKYRYAVSGSLVRYIDKRFGREMTKRLLASTKPDEFFTTLGLTEEQLLADWKRSLV